MILFLNLVGKSRPNPKRGVEKMRARDPLTRQRLTPVRNFRLTLVA